ncbi:hypothetical protein DDZ18_04855 [Marinicauda salina]|uniref:SLH domain-containing protein n=1 Tax=Marinicauda salina TaxID=2135793 RepID=A0A2U2BVA4_9PROT|nr:hypothetical protein DDZ18_04855 [Marinicauda salina]
MLSGGAAIGLAFGAFSLAAPAASAFQGHEGGQSGGHETDHTDHADGDDHQSGGQGQQGGRDERPGAGGPQGGQGGRSLESIFRDVTGADEDSDRPDWAGQPGGQSGSGGGQPEGRGGQPENPGGGQPGGAGSSGQGDLFGDLWIILRDENGVPILTDEGWVQPIDSEGELIALDEEGHPVDETLTQEVEMGRLNVGRAPNSVLDRRAEEVINLLQDATELSTDAAGRLVITDSDGEAHTIDSPLENLAIYVALLTQGSITGVGDLPGDAFDYLTDGVLTAEDLAASASFLAAATDKTGAFTSDEVAYINAFLDINTVTEGDNVTYSVIDYSNFTYDRSDAYEGVEVNVLVQQDDGTWTVESVDIYETVFGDVDAEAAGTLDAYTQAADDARAVINFLHEYEVPVSTLGEATN